MANGWNSDSDREAMLRRVAIVLSSLPGPVAHRLLGTMGEESKAAVRRTMTTLADVDPLERQRALQAFRVSIQQQPVAAPSAVGPSEATSRVMAGASVDITSAAPATVPNGPLPDSPLAFLSDVDDDTLFSLLAVEHPQAIALVLASVAPAQAARILPRLDAGLRSDTLSRLGRLGEIPEAAAAEVAEHFRSRLSNHQPGGRATGRRALDAILAAMPRETAVEELNPPMAQRSDTQAVSKPSLETAATDHPEHDLSTRLRQAVGRGAASEEDFADLHPLHESPPAAQANGATDARSQSVDRAFADSVTPSEPGEPTSLSGATVLESTDSIHQHLVSLTPIVLCQALGKVETRDAMLTLCGLPNHVSEAALSILPRSHAKKVRSSMNGLGSLQLREIDEAKERVARASLAAMDDAAVESMPIAA